MVTNYDRAKLVLDTLDAHAIKKAGASVDADVQKSLGALSAQYFGLMSASRAPVDYTASATHLAYVFRCLATHGDLTYRSLCLAAKRAKQILDRKFVKVACVGGGPGSDALGIIKFVENFGAKAKEIEFVFLDREQNWKRARDALFRTFLTPTVTKNFEQTDLAAGSPWSKSWTYSDADIFVFSFALSEVWAFDANGSVSGYLDKLISAAKPGALFVYTDNGGPNFMPLTDNAIGNRADVKLIASADDDWMLIGSDEQQSSVQSYVSRYGQETKKTGNVNRRIWEKI